MRCSIRYFSIEKRKEGKRKKEKEKEREKGGIRHRHLKSRLGRKGRETAAGFEVDQQT